MASSKRKRSTRKVKSLKAKSVSGKKAKAVKGGLYVNLDMDSSYKPTDKDRKSWIEIHS
jgi:hypothetical protein